MPKPTTTLREQLAMLYRSYSTKKTFKIRKFKESLKLLLDDGSLFISSSTRNAHFRSRINALDTPLVALDWLRALIDNFATEFAYELDRVDRLVSSPT
jgi:hypothetical protein